MSAHLAEIACAAVREAMHHFRKPKPTSVDPDVVVRWGERLTSPRPVPAARDWDEWHWPDTSGYVGEGER